MTRTGTVMAIALAAVATACAGSRGAQGSAAAPQRSAPQASQAGARPQGNGPAPMSPGAMMQCPMAVPGAQVAATDTPDGEAVTFTTTSPEAVPDLRSRVHAMADMYERHGQGRQAMGGEAGRRHDDMGPSGMSGMGSTGSGAPDGASGRDRPMPPMGPAARAIVEDVDAGARVTVTPNDPGDLEQMRSHIRSHVERMQQSGTCGMGPGAQDR